MILYSFTWTPRFGQLMAPLHIARPTSLSSRRYAYIVKEQILPPEDHTRTWTLMGTTLGGLSIIHVRNNITTHQWHNSNSVVVSFSTYPYHTHNLPKSPLQSAQFSLPISRLMRLLYTRWHIFLTNLIQLFPDFAWPLRGGSHGQDWFKRWFWNRGRWRRCYTAWASNVCTTMQVQYSRMMDQKEVDIRCSGARIRRSSLACRSSIRYEEV